ncbi:MAG: PadR family transcriptional regulator [Gaiellaceae bacterium]
MTNDRLRGHVDLLLLAVLEHEEAHGYRLVEVLRGRSDGAFDLPEGTVYPSLYRLERSGLVASRWERVEGRRRRVYRLTSRGAEELARHRSEWRDFARAMEAVVA